MTEMQFRSEHDILKATKTVAMYVRKSRGEGDEDLDRHRSVMRDYCTQFNWRYVEYAEIGTGDLISARPMMQKMIADCKDSMYDAVLVFDYDRLGRGSGTDQDTIIDFLQEQDMVVIVANPLTVFDPNRESDQMNMEFRGFVARQELNQIKKRLRAGKRISLKNGQWAIGKTPYGYQFNPETRKLVPHPVESEIYKKRILERYLTGEVSLETIAWELNQSEIKTRAGNLWSANTISYLLKNQVYNGDIIYDTKKGKRDRHTGKYTYTKLPEEEWQIVHNAHPALKTPQQHQRVMDIMKKRTTSHAKERNALSGLVKCFECGETMIIQKSEHGLKIRNCDICNNSGGSTEPVEHSIKESVKMLRSELAIMDYDDEYVEEKREQLHKEVRELEREIKKHQLALDKIEEAFESGLYGVDKARKKTAERNEKIWEAEGRLEDLKHELNSTDKLDREDLIERIDQFIADIENTKNPVQLNHIYKSIISHIVWKRPDKTDELEITVNFL